MDSKLISSMIAGALVLSGASFWGGIKYEQSQASAQRAQFGAGGQGNRQGGQFRNGQSGLRGGGFVSGEILSVDDVSITIKSPDGSTHTAYLSASTTVSKSSEGIRTDIKIGEQAVVMGTPNQDGSLTAGNVQLGQAFRPRPQGQ